MAGSLLQQPKQIAFDNALNPGIGYQFYTYAAGSLTPKATYQDAAMTIANTNPVTANARGEVVMYGTGTYRVILKDAQGNTIYDRDSVDSGSTGAIVGITGTFSGGVTAATPATGDRSTSVATTQMFASEFVKSLVSNGYQKLPSGLILQWGSGTTSASGGISVNFPIQFPSSCLNVGAIANANSPVGYVMTSSIGGNAYANFFSVLSSTAAPVATGFTWYAIGY